MTNLLIRLTEYIWLLSRDGTLSNPTRQNIYEVLDGFKINRIGLQLSERSTCPSNNTLITRESEQNLGEPEPLNSLNNAPDSLEIISTSTELPLP